jgi:hypothetical protein
VTTGSPDDSTNRLPAVIAGIAAALAAAGFTLTRMRRKAALR